MKVAEISNALRTMAQESYDSNDSVVSKLRELILHAERAINSLILHPVLSDIYHQKGKNSTKHLRHSSQIRFLYEKSGLGASKETLSYLMQLHEERKISLCERSAELLGLFKKDKDFWSKLHAGRNVLMHNPVRQSHDTQLLLEELSDRLSNLLTEVNSICEPVNLLFSNDIPLQVGNKLVRNVWLESYGPEVILNPFVLAVDEPGASSPEVVLFSKIGPDNSEVRYEPLARLLTSPGLKVSGSARQALNRILGALLVFDLIGQRKEGATESAKKYLVNFEPEIDRLVEGFTGRDRILHDLRELALGSHKPNIVVTGPPGYGKSALAAALFRNLQVLSPVGTALSIYLINKGPSARPDAESIWRAVTADILSQLGGDGAILDLPWGGFLSSLLKQFAKPAAADSPRPIVIFDGIDELDPDQQEILLDLVKRFSSTWLRIICLSQNVAAYNRLDEKFAPDFELEYSDESNMKDIRVSTLNKVTELEIDTVPVEELAEKIVHVCRGQFIYQSILIEELRRDLIDISELDSLPHGLDDYYRHLFRRFEAGFESRESFLRYAVPVLTHILLYPYGASITEMSRVLDLPAKFVRLSIELARPIISESVDESESCYGFCHQSVEQFLRNYQPVQDESADVCCRLLRSHQSDHNILVHESGFNQWGPKARSYHCVETILRDNQFIGSWIRKYKLFAHPGAILRYDESAFESRRAFLIAYFRLLLSNAGVALLQYNYDEYQWLSIVREKPDIVNWMIHSDFFREFGSPPLDRKAFRRSFQVLPDPLSEEPEQFRRKPSFSDLCDQLLDWYERIGLCRPLVESLTDFGQSVETMIEEASEAQLDGSRSRSDSFHRPSVPRETHHRITRWLSLLTEIAMREQRRRRRTPHFVYCRLRDLVSKLLSSSHEGVDLLLELPDFRRLIDLLPKHQGNRIRLQIASRVKEILAAKTTSYLEGTQKYLASKERISISQFVMSIARVLHPLEASEVKDIVIGEPDELDEPDPPDPLEGEHTVERCRQLVVILVSNDSTAGVVSQAYRDLTSKRFWAHGIQLPWHVARDFIESIDSLKLGKKVDASAKREVRNRWLPLIQDDPFMRVCFESVDQLWNWVVQLDNHHPFLPSRQPGIRDFFSYHALPENVRLYSDDVFERHAEPENVRLLCDKDYMGGVRYPANEANNVTYRDLSISSVVHGHRLNIRQLFQLVAHYSTPYDRFRDLVVPYIDPSNSDHLRALGNYFCQFVTRNVENISKIDLIPEPYWWNGSRDNALPQEWRYKTPTYDDESRWEEAVMEGELDSEGDLTMPNPAADLIFGWHFLLMHRPSAARQALRIIRTALDAETGDHETAKDFLSCFVRSLFMVDTDTRRKFADYYLKLFPELQRNTLFPNKKTFLSHFYELSDDDLLSYLDKLVDGLNLPLPGSQLLFKDPRRTIAEIKKLDPDLRGTCDISKLLELL